MKIRSSLLFGMAALIMSSATAQEATGDPDAGFQVAVEICSDCHAVSAEQEMSPLPDATPFKDVANTPGMTEMALYAWMTTSHPPNILEHPDLPGSIFEFHSMPDIILEPEDLRNVVAYILSLGQGQ
jgi:mono/diheme cytochrome c family protein